MQTSLDRIIDFISPTWGTRRRLQREYQISLSRGVLPTARSRTDAEWLTPSTTPDDDFADVSTLRSRARSLYHTDGRAHGLIENMVTQVVGTGIRPQSRLPHESLNLTPEEADVIESKIEQLWALFAGECDLTGQQDLYQIQESAYRSKLISGEYFIVITNSKSGGKNLFTTRLQCIDPDRVATPPDARMDRSVKHGIKFDESGSPVGYYLNVGANSFKYIPKFDSRGYLRVIHDFDIVRWGQVRGLSILTAALNEFHDLSRYREAERLKKMISACGTMIVNDPTGAFANGTGVTPDLSEITLRPGAVLVGVDAKMLDPAKSDTAYNDFLADIDHSTAQAAGVPYEIAHNRYTVGSYSSIRAAMISARRKFSLEQQHLISNFCTPIWSMFIAECVARGYITAPSGVLERKLFETASWTPQGYDWIDPLRETQAAVLSLQSNISTYQDVISARTGGDWQSLLNQRAIEQSYIKSHDLTPQSPDFQQEEETNT